MDSQAELNNNENLVNTLAETQNAPDNAPAQAENTPALEETPEQINWRRFREQREIERKKAEEDRKARVEAEKLAKQKAEEALALKQAMEALVKPSNESRYYDDEPDEDEDTRISKKVDALLAERERKAEEERRQREYQEFPNKLVSTFSDFNNVCSTENLDYLEFHYPEVATAFKQLPDGFDKWASIYKAVKRFVPNTHDARDRQRIEKNMNKPTSMSSPAVTQSGDTAPEKLDDHRKKENWKRMNDIIKGRVSS